jgi:hypothetical protein
MDRNMLQLLKERYPFMSICVYAGNEYVGVIQNQDDTVTTMYDFGQLIDGESKNLYLELAATWWWESNRSIPINIFLRGEWGRFRGCLKTFNNRDLQIVHGPVCSLQDINRKKTKRRSITLIGRIQ